MNAIIDDYVKQGFRLTVRQLYYQLVAREFIPNDDLSYKRTTNLVNDARLAGLIDWEAIEDRTRAFVRRQRWKSGRQILQSAAEGFHMDMWINQKYRPFVIIEKEALVGVLEPTCHELDVPLLAARGYPSASVLREFAQDDIIPLVDEQRIIVIHLGDHDPSGIDMTRDLRERIQMFVEGDYVHLTRLALTMNQIEERKPPPNPAKPTDSRYKAYCDEYRTKSCWELDALPPVYLAELVRHEISNYIDEGKWEERAQEVAAVQEKLTKVAKRFKG